MTDTQLSDVVIANLALSRIGVTQSITSFDDTTPAAQQAKQWYFFDRDAELRDWSWPFAQTYVALNQVSTTGSPANPEWQYSYRYPADCLSVHRIVCGQVVTNASAIVPPLTTASSALVYANLSAFREDGDAYPWPFEVSSDTTGRLIYTDAPAAWIKYTRLVSDATQFSPDFVDMLAWRVARDLYGLSRDDKRRDYCEKQYQYMKNVARARAMNESQNSQPFVDYNSESIRSRWVG